MCYLWLPYSLPFFFFLQTVCFSSKVGIDRNADSDFLTLQEMGIFSAMEKDEVQLITH